MNVLMAPIEDEHLVDDFFSDTDTPIIEGIRFDEAVDRVAADELDRQASAAIVLNFERAQQQGDFIRLQQMAMVLGAMACLHDHMQGLANNLADRYLAESFGEHDHDKLQSAQTLLSEDEEEGVWPKNKKKKSRKSRTLLSYFFSEPKK